MQKKFIEELCKRTMRGSLEWTFSMLHLAGASTKEEKCKHA